MIINNNSFNLSIFCKLETVSEEYTFYIISMSGKINAPDRRDFHVLEEGEKRLLMEEDTSIINAATVTINKEDHTLANMLRSQLLNMPSVLFCGYRLPHPLEPRFLLKIQTDGSITPTQAIETACTLLIATLGSMKTLLAAEVRTVKLLGEEGAMGYGDADY